MADALAVGGQMRYLSWWRPAVIGVACLLVLKPPDTPQPSTEPVQFGFEGRNREAVEFRFGVPPMSDTRGLWTRYAQMLAAVNLAAGGFGVRLESALSADGYESKIRSGVLDFVLVDPGEVMRAERAGYAVVAATLDRVGAVIIGRRGADAPSTLLVADDSRLVRMLASSWIAKYSVNTVFDAEVALQSVSRQQGYAACISSLDWSRLRGEYPDLAPIWTSAQFTGMALMAHRRVPKAEVGRLVTQLIQAGPQAGFSGFRTASDESYDGVWEYLESRGGSK